MLIGANLFLSSTLIFPFPYFKTSNLAKAKHLTALISHALIPNSLGAGISSPPPPFAYPDMNAYPCVIAQDHRLPFENQQFDRLLFVHGLEFSNYRSKSLEECWRVLKPNGRMLVMVPARRGFWARNEDTPFGHGNPFTTAQLRILLAKEKFEILSIDRALYCPPSWQIPLWLRWHIGEYGMKILLPRLGGVLVVEVEKRLFAPVMQESQQYQVKTILRGVPASS